MLAAYAGIRAMLWLAPPDLPRIDEIRLDGTVLAFAVGVTTLTALAFGLWPAWRLSRVNLQEALRESGRGMSSSHAAARTRSIAARRAVRARDHAARRRRACCCDRSARCAAWTPASAPPIS